MPDAWKPSQRATGPLQRPGPPGTAPLDPVVRRELLEREVAQGARVIEEMTLPAFLAQLAVSLIQGAPLTYEDTYARLSSEEYAIAKDLIQLLNTQPQHLKQLAMMLTQFETALLAHQEATAILARFQAARLEAGQVEGFSINKYKGAVYPLYNFYFSFQGLPVLGGLFPFVNRPAPTQLLTPELAPPPVLVQKSLQAAQDLTRAAEDLKGRVTDQLKKGLGGFFGNK